MTQDSALEIQALIEDLQSMEDNCSSMGEYLQDIADEAEIPNLNQILSHLSSLSELFTIALESYESDVPVDADNRDAMGADLYAAVSSVIEKHTGRKRVFELAIQLLPDNIH
jgi:hypothetical protein